MLQLLRNRDFVLFWVASAFASIAGMTLEFIISLYAFDLTGSAALFGFLLFIVIVPRVFLYPVVGVIADRYNRKLLLVIPTMTVFVILGLFAGWHFFFAGLAVPHLFGLILTLEAFNIIFLTVSAVIPPMIVPAELLGSANSLGIVYSEAGYFIGVLLGSFVYAALGFGMSLLAVTCVFAACFVFMTQIRLPKGQAGEVQAAQDPHFSRSASSDLAAAAGPAVATAASAGSATTSAAPAATPVSSADAPATSAGSTAPQLEAKVGRRFFAELKEGVRTILHDELVLRLVLIGPIFNFIVIPLWDLVFLFFLRGDLGMEVAPYGAFMALQSVTNVVVALVFAKIYTDRLALRAIRLSPWLLTASLVLILISALISPFVPFWTVLVISFVGSNILAVILCSYIIAKNTLIQKRVRMEQQSRVFSLNRLLGFIMMPIGNFVFGLVVESFGVVVALIVMALLGLTLLFVILPIRASWLTESSEA